MSYRSSSYNEEDVEDKGYDIQDTRFRKPSEDHECSQVMGTITNTAQQYMEKLRQVQIYGAEFTHPGWGDDAEYLSEEDKMSGMVVRLVPAVVKPQTEAVAAEHTPRPLGDLMESVDIIPIISRMPQLTAHCTSSP
jgi:hypothetical protein